ncbi:tRNA pseudouridine synthase A [Candidatus Blochmanniella vafra str. BVAF]|uniref:tRNA pseudouridine synthase A n=1 Tax=Blochmanniella vafra (strain BVAF) TaxID=859654 RepID=E8Q759_BLOVB|nr:tRNA pseudouridine(38-40) synthase TruA [Candidatus Blochmannia vafer]ADV33883.1 tRNA pseudouridine synthase A [Candidatus Blochmannia vafer str. BVAF]
MQKIALGIEYDGSRYCGWQKQKNGISVQDCVENALNIVTAESVSVFCAGRTDSGVHALGQVVHFETDVKYSKSAWTFGVNRYLPRSICIRWVSLMKQDFHARFSAVSRRYYYYIYNDKIRSAILFQKTWHYTKLLDVCKMSRAAQYLLGENDFSAFRSAGCQSYSRCRNLYHLRVIRIGQCVIIDIQANSFLYRMVRNIVGSLVEVGCGNRPAIWILELLKSCKRSLAGMTAPADGLYLAEVKYPDHFFLSDERM